MNNNQGKSLQPNQVQVRPQGENDQSVNDLTREEHKIDTVYETKNPQSNPLSNPNQMLPPDQLHPNVVPQNQMLQQNNQMPRPNQFPMQQGQNPYQQGMPMQQGMQMQPGYPNQGYGQPQRFQMQGNPQANPGMVNPQVHPNNQFMRTTTMSQKNIQNTLDPTGQGRFNINDNKALQNLEENRNIAYENTQAGCGNLQGWCASYICPCCCDIPYKTVPTGFVGVIQRFGKFHKQLKPGLHYLNPDIDVLKLVDMRERVTDLRTQVVVTKDNMSLQIQAVLFYKIFDAHRAMFRVDDVSLLIRDLAVTTMRNVIGNMTFQEFLEKKDELDDRMLSTLEQTVPKWGANVLRVLVQDVALPLEFRNTMSSSAINKKIGEAKMITAQADVEAARLMRDAAEALSTDAALQIRYLDSLELLSKNGNPKMVFFPSDYRDIGSVNEHLNDEVVGLLNRK